MMMARKRSIWLRALALFFSFSFILPFFMRLYPKPEWYEQTFSLLIIAALWAYALLPEKQKPSDSENKN
jgi:hypothetical protein